MSAKTLASAAARHKRGFRTEKVARSGSEHRVAGRRGAAAEEYDRTIQTFLPDHEEMPALIVRASGGRHRGVAFACYLSDGYSMISLKWITETSSSRLTSRA